MAGEISLINMLHRLMNIAAAESFDPATDSLEAIANALGIGPGVGLWMFGIVDATQVASTTIITTNNLQNIPNDVLEGQFWMQVIYNTSAPATAPEGEFRQITNFAQGGALQTFTVDAFSANVEAGDYVCVFHESLLPQEIIAQGTLTVSSATVPADAGRAEVNDYFNGMIFMATSGATRFQPRRIVDYTGAGGIFTLDPNNPLTGVPGLVDYVIVNSQTEFVPAADATINRTPADVIGNKTSTPVFTPDNVSDAIRYLKGLIAASNVGIEPTESLLETWQSLIIDPDIWTVTNPATGAAWNPTVAGAFIYNLTTPNANEFARLVGDFLWQLHSITPNLNLVVKKTIIEFPLIIGVPANVDNTLTLFGWTPDVGNDRSSNNIIGFGLVADALQTITDLAGAETVNTGFGETLTNHNKLRIEVYEGNVDFYLNEVLIATHVTNIPNVPSYPNFFIDLEAGGACALSIGIIKIWYEMAERY
ncbi:MAG: hypothetical protein KAR06_02985 [Deltaproteobacteria bacterium]|nr:hypothetical protein [Deltaproteobacteria bacterium]